MVHSSLIESAAETLRAQGLRMTSQRRLILETLGDATQHLDAEELYQHARERDESISLATVYRTLSLLHKAGLIEQRFFDTDHSRSYYELSEPKEHFHISCTNCDKVIEFETDLVQQIRDEIYERFHIRVERTTIHFEGFCERKPDCDDCPECGDQVSG